MGDYKGPERRRAHIESRRGIDRRMRDRVAGYSNTMPPSIGVRLSGIDLGSEGNSVGISQDILQAKQEL